MSPSLLLFAALLAGCSGTRSQIRAESVFCPVSLSGTVRATDGRVLHERELETVGTFTHEHTSAHMLWGLIPLSRPRVDLSEEINQQVRAKGGDAVVGLKVTSAYNSWTTFVALLSAGLVPTWSDVKVVGDIVKQVPMKEIPPDEPIGEDWPAPAEVPVPEAIPDDWSDPLENEDD